jgi:hemoglobin-like flavoprotein
MVGAQVLTAEDIEHVRGSFDRLWAMSTRTTDLFYSRLFEIAPEFRAFFPVDMDEQKRKFMSTLAIIVGTLDQSGRETDFTTQLARQHVGFGIKAVHYPVVGEALLWSLSQGLGSHWTPSVADAWGRAYALVSKSMIATAYR